MLVDNRIIVKSKNNLLFEKLDTNILEKTTVDVVPAKTGDDTLLLHNEGQTVSYHSRYNPVREAGTFVQTNLNENTDYVLFIGAGLGYTIQAALKQKPNLKFSIFEPSLEIMDQFLKTVNLAKFKSDQVDYLFSSLYEFENLGEIFDKLESNKAQIIIHPVAEKQFKKPIEDFMSRLKGYLKAQTSTAYTDLRFQTRWTTNAIVNINEVLHSPNLFIDIDQENLAGKPVLLVAAGPSLNEEIENIRAIQQQRSAYIFAVGSTVNVLLNNGITPDALFLYDPLPFTANVVKKIKEENLDIPLIYGTSLAFEALPGYPGKKIHFFTNQDSISTNLIELENKVIVPDASTIAALALYIVGKIQMGPIVFVGQNLSITKDKAYADGTGHYDTGITDRFKEGFVPVRSTIDEEIYTNTAYKDMGEAITLNIRRLGLQNKVFNTTQNGLPIEDTIFMSLKEVMAKYLTNANVVDSTVFNANCSYDVNKAVANYKVFEKTFDDLLADYKKLLTKIDAIAHAYEKKLVVNSAKLFEEYDVVFRRFENNPFFTSVIAPITRHQYKEFTKGAKEVRNEKMLLKKMGKFLEVHPKYIRSIYVAINNIQPAFGELKKNELFK